LGQRKERVGTEISAGDGEYVRGDETQIAFNGRYLRDALEAIDTPEVLLQITGPSSPGIIRPAGEPNGYLHVIMPMHVAR